MIGRRDNSAHERAFSVCLSGCPVQRVRRHDDRPKRQLRAFVIGFYNDPNAICSHSASTNCEAIKARSASRRTAYVSAAPPEESASTLAGASVAKETGRNGENSNKYFCRFVEYVTFYTPCLSPLAPRPDLRDILAALCWLWMMIRGGDHNTATDVQWCTE